MNTSSAENTRLYLLIHNYSLFAECNILEENKTQYGLWKGCGRVNFYFFLLCQSQQMNGKLHRKMPQIKNVTYFPLENTKRPSTKRVETFPYSCMISPNVLQ